MKIFTYNFFGVLFLFFLIDSLITVYQAFIFLSGILVELSTIMLTLFTYFSTFSVDSLVVSV